jgi:membrane protease YdiL (CAAX protease family)
MMGAIYLAERALGWLQFQGWAWESRSWLQVLAGTVGGLALFVSVGFQEELFSRGYHLQNMAEGLTLPWGVLLSSAFFGLLHLANPHATWAAVTGILAAGCFLAYAWIRTRHLWLSIGLHVGWNFFEGTVFGFAVSGTGGFNMIQQTVVGPISVTGGPFGPEAGLIILPAMALGAALILFYTRRRIPDRPTSEATTDPAS